MPHVMKHEMNITLGIPFMKIPTVVADTRRIRAFALVKVEAKCDAKADLLRLKISEYC